MAEKEYIEREAATAFAPLPKELREYQTANLDDAFEYGYDFAIGQIGAIPAADVRPVVLCRDCIHFQQFRPHDGFCKIDGMLWNNDFFCANGKREEG